MDYKLLIIVSITLGTRIFRFVPLIVVQCGNLSKPFNFIILSSHTIYNMYIENKTY